MGSSKKALVVGVSGLSGSHAARELSNREWNVLGLSRKKPEGLGSVGHIALDLMDAPVCQAAQTELSAITHVFICTWSMQATEAENIRVNRRMLEYLFLSLEKADLKHVSLVTGLKHYLGPFESYATSKPYSPFLESQPRLDVENFYYDQEDVVFEQAEKHGFSWNVHRPHTMIGYVLGNAMNMAVTLAVYASICKATGRPFLFPGSKQQYNAVADVTDARLLAKQLVWATTNPDAANMAFNTANGDVFRWHWLWEQIADYFDVPVGDFPGHPTPLEAQMADASAEWDRLVKEHSLVPHKVEDLASFWHTDADLGRELECITDMRNSRMLGFNEYQDTLTSFTDVFNRLRKERIIPS